MTDPTEISEYGPVRWFPTDGLTSAPGIADRCTVDVVRQAVAHIKGVEVTSVAVNTSGRHEMAAGGDFRTSVTSVFGNAVRVGTPR